MSIRLENITKRYDQQVVVNKLSLEVQDGEFFVLLGSSGSGKTTVLNIIAGLTEPDQGRVFLHNRDVTRLPPQKRKVGFVFQNYALFRYMNVAENIEFGLQVQKVSQAVRRRKRDELLEQGRTETTTLYIYRCLEERQYVEAYTASILLGLFSVILVSAADWLRNRSKT
jgi:sulfate transport system ATP-binding protein